MTDLVQVGAINALEQGGLLGESLVAKSTQEEGGMRSRNLVRVYEGDKVTEFLRKSRYRETHLAQIGICVADCNNVCAAGWGVYVLSQVAVTFSSFDSHFALGFLSVSAANSFAIRLFSYLSRCTSTGRPIIYRDTPCYDLSVEGARTDCCGKFNCSPLAYLAWTPVILSFIFGLGGASQAAVDGESDEKIKCFQGVAVACAMYMIPNILFASFACMSSANQTSTDVLCVDKKENSD